MKKMLYNIRLNKVWILLTLFVVVFAANNNNINNKSDENRDYIDISDDFVNKIFNNNKTSIERMNIFDEEEEDRDEEEEDYEDGGTGEPECNIVEAFKNINSSDFLPDDYDQVKGEEMVRIVPHFDETWG